MASSSLQMKSNPISSGSEGILYWVKRSKRWRGV